MSEEISFTVRLEQQEDYQFTVNFGLEGAPDLLVDEPQPLGQGKGPNAARLVAAAVANCLSASLLFCMRKFKQTPGKLRTEARATLAPNERGRIRIHGFDVVIRLEDAAENLAHFDRCMTQFEDFCIVTESVRHGIPVRVRVEDATGRVVHEA